MKTFKAGNRSFVSFKPFEFAVIIIILAVIGSLLGGLMSKAHGGEPSPFCEWNECPKCHENFFRCPVGKPHCSGGFRCDATGQQSDTGHYFVSEYTMTFVCGFPGCKERFNKTRRGEPRPE